MNRDELAKKLAKARVPNYQYNLSGEGPRDNRYVMEKKDSKWHVYYFERGTERQNGLFDTEDAACAYLLGKLLPEEVESVDRPLPLGSVVRLRGGKLKLMVVSRALRVPAANGKQYYFDYGAVAYPNGLVTPDMAYFQLDAVEEVYHWGYSDDEDMQVLESIHYFLDTHPEIERGSAEVMGG